MLPTHFENFSRGRIFLFRPTAKSNYLIAKPIFVDRLPGILNPMGGPVTVYQEFGESRVEIYPK